MPKNDSVIRLPVKSDGITTTTPVRIGIMPFFNTCRNITVSSDKPLARAVRT